MVTQTDIAKRVGIDVSSVNKILNKIEKFSFRKETIRDVFMVARQLGYPLVRRNKHYWHRRSESLEAYLCELLPPNADAAAVAEKLGKTPAWVENLKTILYHPPEVKRGRAKRQLPGLLQVVQAI